MLKPIALGTAVVIAIIGMDWMVQNGYRNYLAIPIIIAYLTTAYYLLRVMRNGGKY